MLTFRIPALPPTTPSRPPYPGAPRLVGSPMAKAGQFIRQLYLWAMDGQVLYDPSLQLPPQELEMPSAILPASGEEPAPACGEGGGRLGRRERGGLAAVARNAARV